MRLYNHVKIWEAACATSAASSFFGKVELGPAGQKFRDGGTGANNPVRELWNEAKAAFSNDSADIFVKNLRTIVSIGTGVPDLTPFGDDLFSVGKTLLSIATQTATTAANFHRDHSDLSDDGRYYRFNVARGLGAIGLEEANQAAMVISITDDYLADQGTHSALQRCAKSLGDPKIVEAGEIVASTYI